MKVWLRRDEWVGLAPCGDSIDHILPLERQDDGPTANVARVRDICDSCRVRPECIETALNDKWIGVWCAGQYISVDKRKAKRTRAKLALLQPHEAARRGVV